MFHAAKVGDLRLQATDADRVEETDLFWGDGFESGDTSEWSTTVGNLKTNQIEADRGWKGPAWQAPIQKGTGS